MGLSTTLSNMKFDKRRLQQVILNLLSNAVKFTQEGSIKVHAFVFQEGDDEREYVFEMTVQD